MDINEYINKSPNKAEARKALAHAIGRKEVTIRSWANGIRYPARKIWPEIVSASSGLITIHDLASPHKQIRPETSGK